VNIRNAHKFSYAFCFHVKMVFYEPEFTSKNHEPLEWEKGYRSQLAQSVTKLAHIASDQVNKFAHKYQLQTRYYIEKALINS